MRRARRRGPGVVGTVARTAVIAGTASATVGAVQSHEAKKQTAAQQQAAAEQQAPAPAPAAAAPAGEVDVVTELQKLADMKTQGILTDEQFEAAKAKLLAG